MAISSVPAARHDWGRIAVAPLAHAMVWLGIASGAVVFSEPAPVDMFWMALIVILPLAGLVSYEPIIVGVYAIWLVAAAAGLLASSFAEDLARASTHTGISLYMYSAAMTFAAYIARDPAPNTKRILDAYLCAAVVASLAGLVGYFNLFPGADEILTKFGRATGTFKDPNVFSSFLVPALVYALHLVIERPLRRMLVPLAALALVALGLFLSFSRGAWFNGAVATAVYVYASFVTSRDQTPRMKLIVLGAGAIAAIALVVMAALQIDGVSKLLTERAALTQGYDEGPEGRFGGQAKAIGLALSHPFGLGALEFSAHYHHEDVHNVYISMFLNAGWIGGLIYVTMVLLTCAYGLWGILRPGPGRRLMMVGVAAFVGNTLEGYVIDVDHWRHLYLEMAIVWGWLAAIRATRAGSVNAPAPTARS